MNRRFFLTQFVMCILVGATGGSAANDGATTEKHREFWKWFLTREKEFAVLFSYETQAREGTPALKAKTEKAVSEVGDRLRTVNQKFAPLFGAKPGSSEMIVTAHGEASEFSSVEALIAAAPQVTGWRFTGLKPPMETGGGMEIRSGDVNFAIKDVRYRKTAKPGKRFDVEFFVKAKVADDDEGFQDLFTNLAEDFCGEKLAATTLGKVTVREWGKNAPAGLLPMTGLHKDLLEAVRTAK